MAIHPANVPVCVIDRKRGEMMFSVCTVFYAECMRLKVVVGQAVREVNMDCVTIKGSRDGIDLILDPEVPFDELEERVREKFADAARFFEGAEVILSFHGRNLSRVEEQKLTAAVTESADIHVLYIAETDEFYNALLRSRADAFRDGGPEAVDGERLIRTHGFYEGDVKEGEVIESPEDLLIIGSVEAGAEVLSLGSIVILGRLTGSAHAGVGGRTDSFVAVMEADPIQVTIAGTSIQGGPPKPRKRLFQKREPEGAVHPQLIHLQGDSVCYEPITLKSLQNIHI